MSGENDLVTQLGDSANDTLDGVTGDFVAVLGGGGDDYINVIDADGALVVGGTGNDTITATDIDGDTFSTLYALYGNEGDDVIRSGSASFEWLSGGEGNDTIEGGDGYGLIFGGAGDDSLDGGAGIDLFQFGLAEGDDTIGDFNVSEDFIGLSGFDRDLVTWEAVSANLTEEMDDDGNVATIVDLTEWGGGTIRLEGVAKDSLSEVNFQLDQGVFDPDAPPTSLLDALPGGGHLLAGFSGDDVFSGSHAGDVLFGAEGDDSLDGAGGDDSLFGGEGDDTLVGGAGNDTLVGGEGADTFVAGPGDGDDTVEDFVRGEDMIDLTRFDGVAGFDDLTLRQSGDDLVIDLRGSGGGTLTLEGTALGDIDGDDFLFHEASPQDLPPDSL